MFVGFFVSNTNKAKGLAISAKGFKTQYILQAFE